MRILLIEDDDFLRDTLKKHLSASGFIVDATNNGETGSYTARTTSYNVIILDNLLPHKNADVVIKDIRGEGISTPILLLSVIDDPKEKSLLLDAGADDYLTKPFVFEELISRIKTLGKRAYDIQEPIMTIDDLTVDSKSQTVLRQGKGIYLTRKEYLILECMARRPGEIVTRADLLDGVWNSDVDPFSNTIEAHIRNLRKKIGKGKKKYIHTIPGRGYKIEKDKGTTG